MLITDSNWHKLLKPRNKEKLWDVHYFIFLFKQSLKKSIKPKGIDRLPLFQGIILTFIESDFAYCKLVADV